MSGYGWTKYDVRSGGTQLIHDQELQLDVQTDFTKTPGGEAWAVRVSGTPRALVPNSVKTMVAFHLAEESLNSNEGKTLGCYVDSEALSADQSVYVACQGDFPHMGHFEFWASGRATNKLVGKPTVRRATVPKNKIWKAKGKSPFSRSTEIKLTWTQWKLLSWIISKPATILFPTISAGTCNFFK